MKVLSKIWKFIASIFSNRNNTTTYDGPGGTDPNKPRPPQPPTA